MIEVASVAEAPHTAVIVIETDPALGAAAGGAWWDVAVAEVSDRPAVVDARHVYDAARADRRG